MRKLPPPVQHEWPRLVIEALFLRAKGNYGYREYFLNILNYLIEHSEELHYSQVIIATGERAIEVLPEKLPDNFYVDTVKVEKPYQTYWQLNRLAKRFNLNRNDVIMFTSDMTALVKSCKHLMVIHDWLYLRKNLAPNWLFRLQRSIFVPRSAKLADKIITISQWVKDDVIEHSSLNQEKIVPIYNYLDYNKYKTGVVSDYYKDFCEKNGYFLAVSASGRHKNLPTVLLAYKQYLEKDKSGVPKKLVLVGSFSGESKDVFDNQNDEFKKNVYQLKNVSNRDLGYLYENASAFISATLFEGFGMPIAEAMYFGIPVVVSDIPVVREITGNKAVYFNPMDCEKLSEIMLNIDSTVIDSDGKEIVARLFSKENTVAQYLKVINSMNDLQTK